MGDVSGGVGSGVFRSCGITDEDAVLVVGVFAEAIDCLRDRPIRFTCPD